MRSIRSRMTAGLGGVALALSLAACGSSGSNADEAGEYPSQDMDWTIAFGPGGGNDIMAGFDGADFFVFDTALAGAGVDLILDLQVGIDKIALDDSVFGGLAAVTASNFVTGTSAQDADDRIIYDPNTGALFFDADGNGAGAAVQFAALSTGLALSASDFMVI